MRRIILEFDRVTIRVELLDTPTADALWGALPFDGEALTWGDEVYFEHAGLDAARGECPRCGASRARLAFWTDGDAIAIGFGRTPMSRGDEIRLASPANILARTSDDVKTLSAVRAGERRAGQPRRGLSAPSPVRRTASWSPSPS